MGLRVGVRVRVRGRGRGRGRDKDRIVFTRIGSGLRKYHVGLENIFFSELQDLWTTEWSLFRLTLDSAVFIILEMLGHNSLSQCLKVHGLIFQT